MMAPVFPWLAATSSSGSSPRDDDRAEQLDPNTDRETGTIAAGANGDDWSRRSRERHVDWNIKLPRVLEVKLIIFTKS
jgi:hypothetical protein